MNTDYNLNFTIPQGPTGPTGPQGIQGEIGPTGPTGASESNDTKAIGYLWNNQIFNTTFLANNAPLQVGLFFMGLGLNVKYHDSGAIVFLLDGAYKLDYCVVLQIPEASPENAFIVTVAPKFRDNDNTASNMTLLVKDSSLHYFCNSVIYNLRANDTLSLVITSNKVADFNYYMTYFVAHRLGDMISRAPIIDD